MAFQPNPNLFNSAFGGGLRSGSALADLMRNRRRESELERLAQGFAQNQDYNALGTGLMGIGMVGPGVNAMQVPYQREQNEIDRAFRRDQLQSQRDLADRNFTYRQGQDAFSNNLALAGLQLRQDEIAAKRAEKEAEAARPDAKGEGQLRKEFQTLTKDFRSVRDSYARVNASAANPSAAGDMALIFNYMKILDPGSTVREGEFATAQNAAGIEGRVVSLYNSIINGKRLAPEQRADFVRRAQALFMERQNQYAKTENEFRNLAQQYSYDPNRIVLDLNAPPNRASADATTAGDPAQLRQSYEASLPVDQRTPLDPETSALVEKYAPR